MTAAKQIQGSSLPAIPQVTTDADATKDILHTLRHFHLGNPVVRRQLEPLEADMLPPLLAPYRDASRLRYDYPLFLFPAEEAAGERNDEPLALPISSYLGQLVNAVAPGADSARILKDNLTRLERDLRKHLQNSDEPRDASAMLQRTANEMMEELHLDHASSKLLREDLDRLLAALPAGGQLLSYGRYPAIHLLIHVIRRRIAPRQRRFHQQVEHYARSLQRLLDVEREKSLEAIEPASLQESVGFAASLFNPAALSEVMDHSHGSVGMSARRRQRVEAALATLENFRGSDILARFVHIGTLDQSSFANVPGVEVIAAADPCATATELFDREAENLAKVIAALRIARLEVDNRYEPAIHDPWFANFSWEGFTQEELLLVPAVIALETADRVAGQGMADFSRLLNSGRPIHILVRVLAHANPGISTGENPFSSYRTELGYLGISHRQTVVSQVSAARHEQLLAHFATALEATRTSLHLINIGLRPTAEDTGLNAWLIAGAALEGRVHPFFLVNPAAGDSFAERMDFTGNPQPERDWPVSRFAYLGEGGSRVETELAFTFADYALLIPRLHDHFAPIPLICQPTDLLPVADYLALAPEEAEKYIPFIWGVTSSGVLRRLAISRTLVQACRDRLNFWHALQEMSGIRNRHVELAVAEAWRQFREEADAERETLLARHRDELAAVRAETAGEVMGRLTDVLLGMDLTQSAAPPRPSPAAVATAPQPPAERTRDESQAEQPEEAEEIGFDEPWIDSALCTSCNDCLGINPLLFVYNDSNQAVIGDTSSGTFAQLVEAAELCPSKCIHPGKPLNPAEAGLDELLLRAAPFN